MPVEILPEAAGVEEGITHRREDSPITHLNTTLETIIEMSLSSTTSKDLSLDNESINTEIPCYFFCFIC